MADSSSQTSASGQFQAYYLQQATVELAEDLDALRNADDFAMSAGRNKAAAAAAAAEASGASGASGNDKNGSGNRVSENGTGAPTATFDTPLQMLIEALRQGAEMFGAEDQKRVVAGAAAAASRDDGDDNDDSSEADGQTKKKKKKP